MVLFVREYLLYVLTAPTNCLQYFAKTAGQIESYNFRQEYGGTVRQLADQNYNLCFKRPSVSHTLYYLIDKEVL